MGAGRHLLEVGLDTVRRDTVQRKIVRQVIEEADRPLSPAEILSFARNSLPSMGIATVYRNVKALMEDGYLAAVDIPGEGQRYEKSGKHHHHHFHCRECGKVFEVEGCGVGDVAGAPSGFEVENHLVVLYGRCADCQNLEPEPAQSQSPDLDVCSVCGHHRH